MEMERKNRAIRKGRQMGAGRGKGMSDWARCHSVVKAEKSLQDSYLEDVALGTQVVRRGG